MTCAPVHRTRPDGPFHPDVAVAGRAGGAEPDVDGAEVDVEPVEGAGVREPVDGSDGIDEPVDDGGGLLVDGRVLDGGGMAVHQAADAFRLFTGMTDRKSVV